MTEKEEFTGVSKSRSFDEALKDALAKVEKFHRGRGGVDSLVVAEVVKTFRLGGIAGFDELEVKVAIVTDRGDG